MCTPGNAKSADERTLADVITVTVVAEWRVEGGRVLDRRNVADCKYSRTIYHCQCQSTSKRFLGTRFDGTVSVGTQLHHIFIWIFLRAITPVKVNDCHAPLRWRHTLTKDSYLYIFCIMDDPLLNALFSSRVDYLILYLPQL